MARKPRRGDGGVHVYHGFEGIDVLELGASPTRTVALATAETLAPEASTSGLSFSLMLLGKLGRTAWGGRKVTEEGREERKKRRRQEERETEARPVREMRDGIQ